MKNFSFPGLLLGLLFFALVQSPIFANGDGKKQPLAKGTYYVLAVNGLDMKASSNNISPVIRTIPYGGKVQLVASATHINLKIDRIQGGLAEVTYNGKKGFVFEGYLSRIPPPKGIKNLREYVISIRKAGREIYYEENRKDWSKHEYKLESIFHLPTKNWTASFLITQQFFNIPDRYYPPPPYDENGMVFTLENPEKPEGTTSDELRNTYDAKGGLGSIVYVLDMEGKKSLISIKYDEEKEVMVIRQMLNVSPKE